MEYAELQVTSNFSFLRGASHPHELVLAAAASGISAIAITDRNSLAGVVRAHMAAKDHDIHFIVGTRLDLRDAPDLLCYPTDQAAYGRLCRLLTLGKRRAPKGECWIDFTDVIAHGEGQIFVMLADCDSGFDVGGYLRTLADAFPGDVYLAVHHHLRGNDRTSVARIFELGRDMGVPLIATNDVEAHVPARKPLQDVLTCIREHCTVQEAGFRLGANAEKHIKSPRQMARLFQEWPEAIRNTMDIARRCTFSLDELSYDYPRETFGESDSPQAELVRLTHEGAEWRFADGIPGEIQKTIDHELSLIAELNYAPYFLTVHDIVRFARERGILCQGRGSAANSIVCFCLGITSVDPTKIDLLFERFVSAERNEPPDIDVDFEHERREEVIQYIYKKYGRERAGLAATVITYRSKSAVREVGKAMGLSDDVVTALAKTIWGWHRHGVAEKDVEEIGLDLDEPQLRMTLEITQMLTGFPRHLSQHVGGFVITDGPLCELTPIANAAMDERTTVEWDKDDLDALGILKIDVLALGMLTCLQKGFELLSHHYGQDYNLATVPQDDEATYEMICKADTIGVFQIESRAQMSMLPRLRPRTFYDLVIEVAIVRPGPIQGDMVHPYLRRRSGEEQIDYPSEELAAVLEKTMGVPLFQEQAMRIAIVAAGFSPGEADGLRRAMATFRHVGTIHSFRDKFIGGMLRNGYERDFAERCFSQIEGFGDYGFPESHAAAFALLAYVSAWMKCYFPDVFACGLLNSQPMGFYASAQIVRDAREHGVTVRPVDVNHSDWNNRLEPLDAASMERRYALRLGFRQIKGFREDDAIAIMMARDVAVAREGLNRPMAFTDVRTLWRQSGLLPRTLERLAHADAFTSMDINRREAQWQIRALERDTLPLFDAAEAEEGFMDGDLFNEPEVELPSMTLGEAVIEDYKSLRLSLKAHPVAFLREGLSAEGVVRAVDLPNIKPDTYIRIAGLVLVRQMPGTAKGVVFATLEDETGVANAIVWPSVFERSRRIVMGARVMVVEGHLQREAEVIHVIADRVYDLSHRLHDIRNLNDVPDDNGPVAVPKIIPIRAAIPPPRLLSVVDTILPKSRDFH